MSRTHAQESFLEDQWADFDLALSQGNYAQARAIQDNVGDLGHEDVALSMHKAINRAQNPTSRELYEQNQDANDERGL